MRVLCLFNRQRSRKVRLASLRGAARCLLEELLDRRSYELGVHLIDAGEMTNLNETYLRHAGSTDVITFNHREADEGGGLHGEIFISVDDAVAQARRFSNSWQSEIVRYLTHGVLHLEGYDDHEPAARQRMKRKENKLVKELSRRFDFGKLDRTKDAIKGR